jgi:hypothetical protein
MQCELLGDGKSDAASPAADDTDLPNEGLRREDRERRRRHALGREGRVNWKGREQALTLSTAAASHQHVGDDVMLIAG